MVKFLKDDEPGYTHDSSSHGKGIGTPLIIALLVVIALLVFYFTR